MSRWIFLRGLTREARHWGDFPSTFAATIADAEVHTPDLPGSGQRCRERSPASIAGILEAVRSDLVSRRVGPPYHLLALSLGAMVAVEWARRYPLEVRAAVLINTSLRPFSPFHRRLRPANYPTLARLALFTDDAEACELAIMRMTSRCRVAGDPLLAEWVAWRRQAPVLRANAWRQLFAAMRYRAPLCPPSPPLLLLSSRGDTLVDPACSQFLAARWGVPHAEHSHAGHDLPLDDGPWVAATVGDWLDHPAGP